MKQPSLRTFALAGVGAALALGMSTSALAAPEINSGIRWNRPLASRQPDRCRLQRIMATTRLSRSTRATTSRGWPQGIAAFRAGNAPAILQVYEVGTATMIGAKKAVDYVASDEGRR